MKPANDAKPKWQRWGEVGFCGLLVAVAVAFLLKAESASAREAESEVSASVPCAIISAVGGQVDVLDSSRTHLLDSAEHAAIPCGSWVSVGRGSVELKHRDGFRIHAGAGTFMQLPEPNTDGRYSGDQAVLFRGQVFAQAEGGTRELRVLTANARARLSRGSAIVVYSQEDEETQLIALDRSSSLENRFEISRKVAAGAGEATSLNFKQLRVVPTTARAVAIASLRPKFEDLRVPERDRKTALHKTHDRQERIFASELVDDSATERKPASIGEEVRANLKKAHVAPLPDNYSGRPSDEQVQAIRRQWVGRLAAGEGSVDHLIAPVPRDSRKAASRGTASVQSTGSVSRAKAHRVLTPEDEEKLRLIEELSRIRDE